MAKLTAINWNGGVDPLAIVSTANRDHNSMAVEPIRVAAVLFTSKAIHEVIGYFDSFRREADYQECSKPNFNSDKKVAKFWASAVCGGE
ncbi:MAG: hypothetical protein V3U76_11450 [Granulosicoccus sp.]